MKKNKLFPGQTNSDALLPKLEEPMAAYLSYPSVKKIQATIANFNYQNFEQVAQKVPFSQQDWAKVLHLSERTLQRYSKDNKNFEGIYADRILQIDKIFVLGLSVFNSANALYQWLQTPKQVMGQLLDFDSLAYTDGIRMVLDQLGRIEQGVYA